MYVIILKKGWIWIFIQLIYIYILGRYLTIVLNIFVIIVIVSHLLSNNVVFLNWVKNIKYSAENGASRKIVDVHPQYITFQPSNA